MRSYRILSLNGSKLIGTDLMNARDDGHAIALAKVHGRGELVEVWEGQRRVAAVSPLSSKH